MSSSLLLLLLEITLQELLAWVYPSWDHTLWELGKPFGRRTLQSL